MTLFSSTSKTAGSTRSTARGRTTVKTASKGKTIRVANKVAQRNAELLRRLA